MSRTVSPSIEEQYYFWLYSKVGAVCDKNPAHSIFILAELLHNTEFVPHIPNDENRALEAKQLRDDFVDTCGSWKGSKQPFLPCSMFELMIGLAIAINIQCGGTRCDDGVGEWFWTLLRNCGLAEYVDAVFLEGETTSRPQAILNDIINRTYKRNGEGGFFPVTNTKDDQREIELWYQMSAYLIENSGILDR